MKRYEKKFGFSPEIKASVENLLYRAGFKKAFPHRRISSFYYDDSVFSNYSDSIRGHGNRLKLRARMYNMDPSRIVLERKLRDNDLGYKTYDFSTICKGTSVEILYRDGTNSSPVTLELPKTLDGANKPVLVVSYTRNYYQSIFHPDLRVTVDSKIGYGRIYSGKDSYAAVIDHSTDRCVLEIKVPQQHEELISFGAKVLQRLHLTNERHSKYCNAVEILF